MKRRVRLSDFDSKEAQSLYQKAILDHNKSELYVGSFEHPDFRGNGYNPICGDKITIVGKYSDQLLDIKFQAESCALCRASASLMCQFLNKANLDEVQTKTSAFLKLLEDTPEEFELSEELLPLAGIMKFRARIQCVKLPWTTLKDALAKYESNPSSNSGETI